MRDRLDEPRRRLFAAADAVVHPCKGAEVRSRVLLTARQSVEMPVPDLEGDGGGQPL